MRKWLEDNWCLLFTAIMGTAMISAMLWSCLSSESFSRVVLRRTPVVESPIRVMLRENGWKTTIGEGRVHVMEAGSRRDIPCCLVNRVRLSKNEVFVQNYLGECGIVTEVPDEVVIAEMKKRGIRE